MIVGVAIRYQGSIYGLWKPHRHHHIMHRYFRKYGKAMNGVRSEDFGFIDHWKGFVNRSEARKIALEEGQILETLLPDELYSEDVW